MLEFIETSTFTKRLKKLLSDERYRALQSALIDTPRLGSVIAGTGGARKLRWSPEGRGKSGGVRVIYYFNEEQRRCFLLVIYSKGERDNLTDEEKRTLKILIKRHLV